MAGFQIATDVYRDSRTLGQARVKLADTDGNTCVTGSSMHLVRADFISMPTAAVKPLKRADAAAGPTPLARGEHGEPSFSDFIEVAYPDGVPEKPANSTGPMKLWMKTPPLLADETLSTAQRLCPLADCGNGISRNAGFYEITFMNTDLTIHFHRETDADWFLSDCISHWQMSGIGMAQAVLSDQFRQMPTIDAPRDIMPGRNRKKRARVIIETTGVIKPGSFKHRALVSQHAFNTVKKPPRGTEAQTRVVAR